jgi:hypothetical protein
LGGRGADHSRYDGNGPPGGRADAVTVLDFEAGQDTFLLPDDTGAAPVVTFDGAGIVLDFTAAGLGFRLILPGFDLSGHTENGLPELRLGIDLLFP